MRTFLRIITTFLLIAGGSIACAEFWNEGHRIVAILIFISVLILAAIIDSIDS